jgi:hypothetical protein
MVFQESRGEVVRERDGSTATFTLVVDLPEALRAPVMGLLRLQYREAQRVRGSGVGVNEQQRREREGPAVFILLR